MSDICPMCKGDKEVARLAKMLGHRPDKAFAYALKIEQQATKDKAELLRELGQLVGALRIIKPVQSESYEEGLNDGGNNVVDEVLDIFNDKLATLEPPKQERKMESHQVKLEANYMVMKPK